MTTANRTGTIRHNVLIPLSTPEAASRALLSSKIHTEFTGSEAKCSARVGGKFTAWDQHISGKNIKLVKDKLIVQEWKTSEWPEGYEPSILKISLKKEGEGTKLTMIQTRVPASQVDQYDKGWYESYWEPLKQYFGTKAPSK
jgi:activator of HSP90 ATPase